MTSTKMAVLLQSFIDEKLTSSEAADALMALLYEDCATTAEFFNDGAHIAHDIKHGRFPQRSSTNDAIAEVIRAKIPASTIARIFAA